MGVIPKFDTQFAVLKPYDAGEVDICGGLNNYPEIDNPFAVLDCCDCGGCDAWCYTDRGCCACGCCTVPTTCTCDSVDTVEYFE